MQNILRVCLSSTEKIDGSDNYLNVIFDGKEITSKVLCIDAHNISIEIPVSVSDDEHCLMIIKNVDDRIKIKLDNIKADGIVLAPWFLQEHGVFSFSDQIHRGSREWHPAGRWCLTFRSPLLTWILDQKIAHEARYSQDYLFPWSYKLGPSSVHDISEKIQTTMTKVHEIL